jgi:AAA domain
VKLEQVFGVSDQVQMASYVDRGGLDERLRYLLRTRRHIAIFGESQQGKSWLRRRLLSAESTVAVQCVPGSTPESLLAAALGRIGVRAELKQTRSKILEGQLQFGADAEAGGLLAKLKLGAQASGKSTGTSTVDDAPLAQTPGDLEWVARVLNASEKRVVFEDFHYLAEEHRPTIAAWIKALGEYGLHVIVVGVWTNSHFLPYYQGELLGRVEDVPLTWSDAELDDVLMKGSHALNIDIAPTVRSKLVHASHGNVGLLQQLAERLCLEEGVLERKRATRRIEEGPALQRAAAALANAMQSRFFDFASNFVQGSAARSKSAVYLHMLRAFLSFEDHELLGGVSPAQLRGRVEEHAPGAVAPSDISNALTKVESVQKRTKVKPDVLHYSRDRRRLFLVDRSLLFYRNWATSVQWPWDEEEPETLF